MDAKYLEEIKARAAAATSGPWNVGNGDDESWFCGMESVVSKLRVVANRAVYGAGSEFDRQTYKDIKFIAAARTDIPALVAEVERLRSCKCVNKCKLVCMLEEYDKVVAERDTLKKALETEKGNYCELCKNIAAAHGVDTFCSHCPKWRGIQQEQGDTLPEDRTAPENASEVVKNLWALYDKYEDAEHAVCGKAATLLSAAPEAPHGLQTTWDTPHTCKHCHEHLAEDWSYCPECGRPTGENKPLTLDELRRMDGEPVWESWTGSWRIVTMAHDGETTSLYNAYNSISAKSVLYNDGRIYARKPEQEAADE